MNSSKLKSLTKEVRKMKKVYICIILSAFLFGTMNVSLKIAGASFDPLQLTFIRFFVGGLVLLPPAMLELRRNKTVLSIKDRLQFLILGIICIPVSMILFQLGVDNMNASTSAVLFCINPIFTMIFACTISDEKFTKTRILAVIIAASGFIFMAKPWNLDPGNTLKGCLFMLLSAVTFSLYSVLGKNMIKKAGAITTTSLSFISGSLVLLIVIVIMGRPVIAGISSNIPLILYVGIFVTGFGYLLYFMAIKGSDASTGSIVFFLKPAIAPVAAVIVLHETLLWNSFLGIILMLAASYINLRESRKQITIKCSNTRRENVF